MKIFKRLFGFLIFCLLLVVFVAITIPYFFKDDIELAVQDSLNDNLNAEVEFEDVNISLFSSFPNLTFQLLDYKIDGVDDFEGITLTKGASIDFTFDLMSAIKSERPIEIKKIHFEKPYVNLVTLKNGKVNYDILKDTGESTSSGETNFQIEMEKYSIEDGEFYYNDKTSGTSLSMVGLNHSGKGDFTQDNFDLVTTTNIKDFTAKAGGIAYINHANTNINLTLDADISNNTYTIKENDIRINALKLNSEGFVALPGNDIKMDIKFDAPQNDFKNFLSLIPSAYTSDFDGVQADGKLQLDGFVKGTYNADNNKMPAFKVNLNIDNGSFQYPSLPMGVSNILTAMTINSPSSDFDQMTVSIPDFKLKIGDHPVTGKFNLKNPISDPDIDAALNGLIDLQELSKAFPIEGLESMSGSMDADVAIKTRMSYVDKGMYDKVNMNGDIKMSDFKYKSQDMPLVNIRTMEMNFTPQKVIVKEIDAKLGKSDIKGSGTIDNILAYISPEKTMKGTFNVSSNYFDANEWISESETTAAAPATPQATGEVFDRFDMNVKADVKKLDYGDYTLKNTSASGQFSPSRFKINNINTKLGKSDFKGSGTLDNVFPYVFENEEMTGDFKFDSQYLDLNEFMSEEAAASTATTEDYEPILIPENMKVTVLANVGKIKYTDKELTSVKGKMVMADQKVVIKNGSAKMLGGDITMDGVYDSQDVKKPTFDMDYGLKNFSFKKSFQTFNTIKQLAPIAQFIDGTFNTDMQFSGDLGSDLSPILNSLNADGFVQTINGVVRGLKPLQDLGNQLNISALKNVEIKNTKNWIEVKNGLVTLKDFKYSHKDIDMLIGGTHSFTQDMNYHIKAKIPREMFEKNVAGQAANKGIEWLNGQASKYGIPIDVGDYVDVEISMTGSMKNPKVKTKLLGTGGKSMKQTAADVAKNAAKAARDSIMRAADKRIADAKEKANAEIDKAAAKAKEEAKKQVEKEADKVADKIKDKVKDEVGEKVGDAVGEKAKEAADKVLGEKGTEAVDKVKDKLKDFNPFKKKPKPEGGGR